MHEDWTVAQVSKSPSAGQCIVLQWGVQPAGGCFTSTRDLPSSQTCPVEPARSAEDFISNVGYGRRPSFPAKGQSFGCGYWLTASSVIMKGLKGSKTQPHDDRDNCFLPFDSKKGPCGMTVNSDMMTIALQKHCEFHTRNSHRQSV